MDFFSVLATEEGGSDLLRQEFSAVILLVVAAAVAVFARRVKVPFTVALVVVGLGFAFFPDFLELDVSSELILGLLVPPLLFEANLQLSWPKLKADLGPVLLCALAGTLIGTFMVAVVANSVIGIPWLAALAFGALVSATDPVAVIALFKSLGVPKRLSVLVEGESLFNDAVAVVIFNLAIAAAIDGESLEVGPALKQFLIVGAGGLAVGLFLGYVTSAVVLARIDEPLIETTTTLAVAYGSYIVAESFGSIFGIDDLHFSGILSVVAAGLVVGNMGLKNTSPSTRLTLEHFWELITFLVNSVIFLFIGIQIDLTDLAPSLVDVFIAIVVVLVSRAVIVYGLGAVYGAVQPANKVPLKYQHVQMWGGLRGAISLALALLFVSSGAFSDEVGDTVKLMTFGVVLFTLLIQGTTIGPLIDRLGLAGKVTSEVEQQRHQARIYARTAGRDEVARLAGTGVLFQEMADAMLATYDDQISEEAAGLGSHFKSHPELEVTMLLGARRDALVAEQSALLEMSRRGLVSAEIAHDMTVEINNRLAALDLIGDRWEGQPELDGMEDSDVR